MRHSAERPDPVRLKGEGKAKRSLTLAPRVLISALAAVVVLVVGLAVAAPGAAVQVAQNPSGMSPIPSDTFAHARHAKLACLVCHLPKSQTLLTFQPPRGCQICHHADPARNDCARCHEPDSLPKTLDLHLAIAAAGKPPRDRTIAFPHARHTDLRCTACHAQLVTMAPADSAATCRGCHAEHHEAGRSCATCHRTESIVQTHAPPVNAHVACDACHPTAAITPLSPTRSFCLVCHDPAVDHNPGRECATCHLQSDPQEYRGRLLRGPPN